MHPLSYTCVLNVRRKGICWFLLSFVSPFSGSACLPLSSLCLPSILLCFPLSHMALLDACAGRRHINLPLLFEVFPRGMSWDVSGTNEWAGTRHHTSLGRSILRGPFPSFACAMPARVRNHFYVFVSEPRNLARRPRHNLEGDKRFERDTQGQKKPSRQRLGEGRVDRVDQLQLRTGKWLNSLGQNGWKEPSKL